MKMTMVATLMSENQNSNSPKLATLQALAARRPSENAATQNQRKQREAGEEIKTMSAGSWAKNGGGFYSFDHGHLLLWTRWANPEDRPLYERRDELARDFGAAGWDGLVHWVDFYGIRRKQRGESVPTSLSKRSESRGSTLGNFPT